MTVQRLERRSWPTAITVFGIAAVLLLAVFVVVVAANYGIELSLQ